MECNYGCMESKDESEQQAFVAKMRAEQAAQEAAREEEDRLLFGDRRAMNLEDVRETAAYVREAAAEEDWESAHGAEDELASDFIQSLATGKLSDLQAIKQMAGEIFELLHEERTRWYA